MPGDQGLVSITLTNTASGSVKTESSGSGSGDGSSVSTSTEINPVIEQVTLDGGREIRVLGGDRQYRGVLGPAPVDHPPLPDRGAVRTPGSSFRS